MTNDVKIYCKKEEDGSDLYFAEVTHKQGFTCGQGYGKSESDAISEACSNAYLYVKRLYGEPALFKACIEWATDKMEKRGAY